MPLIYPILDDRSFEDLFLELRSRIPVYNPAWTDHLDSDPGITLLQLFAYLGEGLQFRFNQIPEATQIAFLKLLGVPLHPARPARALVRFESKLANGMSLYAGDQVKAGKILYTIAEDATVWPLDCVGAARVALLSEADQADDAKVRTFLGALDEEKKAAVQASIDALRLGANDQVAPYELQTLASDGSGEPLDFSFTVDRCVWIGVLLAKDATISLANIADPNLGIGRAESRNLALSLGFAPATRYPTIDQVSVCAHQGNGPALVWQASLAAVKKDGGADYQPVRVAGDTTAGFTQEGVVRLELPADLTTLGVPTAPADLAGTGDFPPELDDDRAQRLWFWLRVWRDDRSYIGPVRLLSLNTVAVEQTVAAAPELLGTGTGQPGQAYSLAHAPVLLDAAQPVRLQVEEASIWTSWNRVDDFDASGPEDRHFTVDAEAGVVRFGDGQAGRLPQFGERIRVLAYHWGGGGVGNLPANSINKLGELLPSPTPPAKLIRANDSLKCSNPLAAYGGVDAESIDAALARIPSELRRNHRAVARDDFAELALQTPAVVLGRAECMPLFHAPSRAYRPGCVSVVVWPARDPRHPNAPLPDAWELAQVCSWLDRWRLITTELYVIPPTYRRIAVAAAVKVRNGYGLDAVRDWVELLLRQYLSPLPPFGPDGAGWSLGRRIMAAELGGVAMQAEGVDYIETLRLDYATPVAGGETWHAVDILKLDDWEVPEVAAVTIVDAGSALPEPGKGLTPPPANPAVPVPVLRDVC